MHLRMGWKHPNGENMGQLALSWTSRRAGYSQRSLACGGGRKQAIVPRTVLRPVALESVAMADCRIVVKPYRLTLGPSRTVTLPGGESSHDHERGPV
jgi:hypothetical protein